MACAAKLLCLNCTHHAGHPCADACHDQGVSTAQNVVVSCSLDGTIKVWQPVETPTPGAVLDATPVYVHPPEEPGHPVRLNPICTPVCHSAIKQLLNFQVFSAQLHSVT